MLTLSMDVLFHSWDAQIASLAHRDAVGRGHPLHHISIDCGFGFVRKWAATDAAAYEGARLREGLLDKTNTASGVWGPIPPIGRRRIRRSWRSTASPAAFTARSPKGGAMAGAIR